MTLDAGRVTVWLGTVGPALRGRGESDVPCGTCTACCRSSQFVLVEADEAEARAAIPADLLFPAPFRPGAHLLPYDAEGRCPMLSDAGCTVYDARPRTCRAYDCRVFAAADVVPDKPAVAEQVRRWRFDDRDPADADAHAAVMAAARWIGDHAASLPEHLVPPHPTALAVLAVEVHHLFLDGATPDDPRVLAALEEAVVERG